MKRIFKSVFVCAIFVTSSVCHSQNNLIVQALDENQQPLSYVEIIIRGITEDDPEFTDAVGKVFYNLDSLQITSGQEIIIVGTLNGYTMKEGPKKYVIKRLPNINFTTIVFKKPKCGFISLNDYTKKYSKFSIGFGFGYKKGDHVTLGNIPRNIRTVDPHPDDVKYRPDDILDPNNPDNYLIIENTVHVALEHRISLDVHFRFWGILNIAIQTSEIKGSEVKENENFYRKSYIKEGSPGGDALIYYLVRSKNRSFLDRNSFSLPIYITYPVFYCGKNKEVIFHLVGGTNLLLSDKISLEAEKGWHRFNERQKETTFDLGKLKETEFFAGFKIEGAFTKSIRFGLQFTLVYTEYQEDFNVPLSLQQSNEVLPSLRLNLTKLFGYK